MHSFKLCVVVFFAVCHITHLFGDVAVFIDVIQIKGPVELLGHRTSEQHRQADDKVLEADRAVSVHVKRVEQKVGVGRCICGNEVSVTAQWLNIRFGASPNIEHL